MRTRCLLGVVIITLLVASCAQLAATPTPTAEPAPTLAPNATAAPSTEEIRFQSGHFEVVGELRLPAGGGKHPAIVMVHGDGPATRYGAVPFTPMIDIFLRNGYAAFSWDKPGSGESTGDFDYGRTLTHRAAILADGIKALGEHPGIDPTRIGLWGISQAGWVMPLALELADNVAFMIVVSGGGEDSIEQMAYQYGQKLVSAGRPSEQAAILEENLAQACKATQYAEYRDATEKILEIPALETALGFELELQEEDEWQPWPRDIDAFIDPMEIIKHTTIPVLAFFGELDRDVDPVQGAEAYEAALQAAGNRDYQIEVLPGVGHVFVTELEYLRTLEAWLQHLRP
jgi:pimeloyl-ACP methyl ester carboxylesterase